MSSSPTTTIRAFAESLAREAGALLMRYQREGFTVDYKAAIDLVTTADRESERLIIGAISQRFPDHLIVSEETLGAPMSASPDQFVWYVDPLDGTTSFAHHYPTFAVSLALYQNAQPLVGVIYDPTRDELFAAHQGGGAACNRELVHVSRTGTLIESLLTSGFPYGVHESGDNVDGFERLTLLSRGVRISGAAALDMAWVACGRLDGYWEPVIAPWDGAAGALIVREAGGRMTNYDDEQWLPSMRPVLATNGVLHAAMLGALPKPQTPPNGERGTEG